MRPFKINVETANENAYLIATIEKAAEETLLAEGSQEGVSINILLTGDNQLRELNRRYRSLDRETDVLSFPFDASVPELENHLGDIAISVERAQNQALQAGHSVESEIQLLVVHGILHLLGYDHDQTVSKQIMWSRQALILDSLNADILFPVEDDHDR